MKFLDFFAGIGGFHSGVELAGHRCVGYVEWDKFARQSYEAIYDTEGMYTAYDITKIKNGNELPKSDVWCFGSPCTNISLAGNREGLHGSASSMFFEVMRLLRDREEVHRPAYLLMENVKNLLSSNGGRDFAEVLIQMDENGYDVEWQVLNSKEVVPQNRERVFIVGHRRGVSTNKVFPVDLKKYHTENRILADVLQKEVDDKYYLSEEKQKLFIKTLKKPSSNSDIKILGNVKSKNYHGHGTRLDVYSSEGIMSTLLSSDYKDPKKIIQLTNIIKTKSFGGNPQTGRVYSINGISPTFNTMQGGGREPKIYDVPKVRKLTPLECWRLQGFTDEQFYKAKETGMSDSQLYKQAGNAVTVPVIHAIADRMEVEQ